DEWV
ncbi:autoinducer 1 sensor kinase/phosphatase luxN, partial [Vibrio parahaemolyticus AQ3810]